MNTPLQELINPVLVCVHKPTIEGYQSGDLKWRSLENALAKTTDLTENSRQLVDNVWLFPEKDAALRLSKFVQVCQGFGLACEVYKIQGTVEKWAD